MMVFWSRQKAPSRGASRKVVKPSREPFAWSRLLPPVLPIIVLMLLAMTGAVVYQLDHWLQQQAVERVVVTGELQHTERSHLISKVKPFLTEGFFTVDLDGIQQELEAMPWVYSARLERRWPGSLLIRVVEQRPVARWGEQALLSQYGDVFQPEQLLVGDLPQLDGVVGSEQAVMRQFVSLQAQLQKRGLVLGSLIQNSRGSWTATLNGGVELLLGRGELDKKMRRFDSVFQQRLQTEFLRVARVDLRYSNGLAVAWRKRVEKKDSLNKV